MNGFTLIFAIAVAILVAKLAAVSPWFWLIGAPFLAFSALQLLFLLVVLPGVALYRLEGWLFGTAKQERQVQRQRFLRSIGQHHSDW